jgi:hypothetical protein
MPYEGKLAVRDLVAPLDSLHLPQWDYFGGTGVLAFLLEGEEVVVGEDAPAYA